MQDLWRDLSRVTLGDRALDDVLSEITAIAARGIPGAEATSITLIRGERAFTAAYSAPMALAADEMQYERGYGPCMDAARGGLVLIVGDMRTEQRWPDYTARVLEVGVRASLSVPLPYQGDLIGALNVYSTTPGAFSRPEAATRGEEVAEAIAVAVANVDAHHRVGEEARNMRLAMESRAVIEQAKGVLMAQRRVDADQAFDILRAASQRANRKLRDVAAGVVASTTTPPTTTPPTTTPPTTTPPTTAPRGGQDPAGPR
ncbi:GAF and ANTAR domain-containing protein [Geodermatophilus marinus]|uniref:GAF and ANTAR domain-containing protein n=1 Tax=Geodermatophilus sp. LHW52908 TaxID=2303986 RepID=UPI001F38CBE9|nr:GAF and ANTAR domain-containing protein [Geodermatophilus sp. LHW52908]